MSTLNWIICVMIAFAAGYCLPYIINGICDHMRSSRPHYNEYKAYKTYVATLNRYNVVELSYDDLRAIVNDIIHNNIKSLIDVDTHITRNDGMHFYRWTIPGWVYNATGFKVIDLSALSYNEFADLYKDMVPRDDPDMVKATVRNYREIYK